MIKRGRIEVGCVDSRNLANHGLQPAFALRRAPQPTEKGKGVVSRGASAAERASSFLRGRYRAWTTQLVVDQHMRARLDAGTFTPRHAGLCLDASAAGRPPQAGDSKYEECG